MKILGPSRRKPGSKYESIIQRFEVIKAPGPRLPGYAYGYAVASRRGGSVRVQTN